MTPNPNKKDLLPRSAQLEKHVEPVVGPPDNNFINGSTAEVELRKDQRYEQVQLTATGHKVFVAGLLSPPLPGARLKKAANIYREKNGASDIDRKI